MALRTGSWPREVEQLVTAGGVDGVEHGGAAAGAQTVDAALEGIDVVGPVRGHGRGNVESHDKGAVALGFQYLEQKLSCRLLLELKTGADGGAGVDDDAYAQGQIDLLVERGDLRGRLLVVEQREVALLQIGDVVAVLVSHREDQVDLVDAELEGRAVILALSRLRGCLAGGLPWEAARRSGCCAARVRDGRWGRMSAAGCWDSKWR